MLDACVQIRERLRAVQAAHEAPLPWADLVAAAYADAFDLDPLCIRDGWVRISGRRH